MKTLIRTTPTGRGRPKQTPAGKLDDKAVSSRTLPSGQPMTKGYYNDGNGLYLVIGNGDQASWVYRYRWTGKLREMGLGSVKRIGKVSEARQLRDKWQRELAAGRNPLEIREADADARRKAATNAMDSTFGTCALNYIAEHEGAWRNQKHRAEWRSTLNRLLSVYV